MDTQDSPLTTDNSIPSTNCPNACDLAGSDLRPQLTRAGAHTTHVIADKTADTTTVNARPMLDKQDRRVVLAHRLFVSLLDVAPPDHPK